MDNYLRRKKSLIEPLSKPSWDDSSIPPASRLSQLRSFTSSFSKTFRSIFRNRRRSLAMIAGLILGVSILAGILIYSNVLMNNIYDTIIEGLLTKFAWILLEMSVTAK
jgi:hypothetical protein